MALNIPATPRLNKKDPLARGLVLSVPLAYTKSGIIAPLDLVTGLRFNVGGSPGIRTTKFGRGADFTTSGQYFYLNHPLFSSFDELSAHVLVVRDSPGSGTGYGSIFHHLDSSINQDWFSFENDNGDSGWGTRVNTMYNHWEKVWSIPYLTNGVPNNAVITYDHRNTSNTPSVIINRVPQTLTNRFDQGWTKTINATRIAIGSRNGSGSWDGWMGLFQYWDRKLTPKEAWRLQVDPGALFIKNNFFSFYIGKPAISLNTYSITKQLKYSVRVSPSVTKSIKYTIHTTQTINKGLEYAIINSESISKSINYTIKSPVAITKQLKYTVKVTPSALTKSTRYAVKTVGLLNNDLQYAIKVSSGITKGLQYSVLKPIASTKDLVYKIKQNESQTKNLKYTVISTPSAVTKSLQYVVVPVSLITKNLQYAVRVNAAATKSLAYAIKQPEVVTKSLKYTVRVSQSAITKNLKYAVLFSGSSISKQIKYAVKFPADSISKQLKYAVKSQPESISKSLKYVVVAPEAVTKQLKYAVYVSTSATKTLKYSIEKNFSVQKSLRYVVYINALYTRRSGLYDKDSNLYNRKVSGLYNKR